MFYMGVAKPDGTNHISLISARAGKHQIATGCAGDEKAVKNCDLCVIALHTVHIFKHIVHICKQMPTIRGGEKQEGVRKR